MTGSSLAGCRFWDSLAAPQAFLADDRDNPARAAAAAIVSEEVARGARTLVEIGPGPGYCYRDHLSRIAGLSYVAYEGSALLRSVFLEAAPEVDVRLGGFDALTDQAFDVVYTKATLEHQSDFRDGLMRMLRAARRLVLVNWYLPPAHTESLLYNEGQGLWYNTYSRSSVLDFLASIGFVAEMRSQPPPRNELWLIRPLAGGHDA